MTRQFHSLKERNEDNVMLEPGSENNDRDASNPRAGGSASGGETDTIIVGIGASAGGIEAVTDLLAHLPVDTGMAFVVVQHLAPIITVS